MRGGWKIFFILCTVLFLAAGVFQIVQGDLPSALLLLFLAGMLVYLFLRDRKKGGDS